MYIARVNATGLASAWGLSRRRIYQLVEEMVIPAPVNGRFDPKACTLAYVTHLRAHILGNASSSLTAQRERLTKAKADQAELELRKIKGQLINTDAAMQLWGEVIRLIRARLIFLPGKMAPTLVGAKRAQEVRDILEKEVYGVLNELASPDLYTAAREATKNNGKGFKKRRKISKQS